MPSVIVKIEPAVIDWVIENVPFNFEVVDTLSSWKNNSPTFREIEDISRTTHIPLGYFFLKNPPKEDFPLLAFRTVMSKSTEKPSRNAVDVINQMENIQEWMRNYSIDEGYEKLNFVGSANINQDKQTIAQTFRDILPINTHWQSQVKSKDEAFKFFRRKLSEIGILVMMSGVVGKNNRRLLDIEEFRAFALKDEYAPLIFINSNDSQGAKLFSLMHEAVHLMLGFDDFYNDRDRALINDPASIETLCNAVTAEILVPNNLFRSEWTRTTDDLDDKINCLAETFYCGPIIIARRALDNSFITKELYQKVHDKAIDQYNDSRSRRSPGGNYYATLLTRVDNRFVMALDNSVREGKTQFTEAYRLTDTNSRTYSKLVCRIQEGHVYGE